MRAVNVGFEELKLVSVIYERLSKGEGSLALGRIITDLMRRKMSSLSKVTIWLSGA